MKKNFRPNGVRPVVNAVYSAILILGILICLCPLAFVAVISFSAQTSIDQIGYSFFPRSWSLQAYQGLFSLRNTLGNSSLLTAMGNSMFITFAGTLLCLFLVSSMGYALAQPTFRFRRAYAILVVIPMIFDGGLLSTYVVNTQLLGLRNTLWAIILPLCCSSLYIFFMRTWFMSAVPEEMIESARLDGAGQFCIFFRLVLPVSKPALSAIGLMSAFNYWNDWYQASLYIESRHSELYPLQYLLVSIEQSFSAEIRAVAGMDGGFPQSTVRMAAVVISIVPAFLCYLFFYKALAFQIAPGEAKE